MERRLKMPEQLFASFPCSLPYSTSQRKEKRISLSRSWPSPHSSLIQSVEQCVTSRFSVLFPLPHISFATDFFLLARLAPRSPRTRLEARCGYGSLRFPP